MVTKGIQYTMVMISSDNCMEIGIGGGTAREGLRKGREKIGEDIGLSEGKVGERRGFDGKQEDRKVGRRGKREESVSGIMSVNSRDLMEEMEGGREQRSVVGKRKVLRETEGRKEGRTEYILYGERQS